MKDKDKKKCIKIVKKLLGESFYFVHGTNINKIHKILKSGEIKLGTEISSNNTFFGFENNSTESKFGENPYIYCWAKFDDIPNDGNYFIGALYISPLILLKENVIFNTIWWGEPLKEKNVDEVKKYLKQNTHTHQDENFSIYLNKNDSIKNRIEKIKLIKKIIINRIKTKQNQSTTTQHEFLFENRINLKSYLIGILSDFSDETMNDSLSGKFSKIKKCNIHDKFQKDDYHPQLIDMCPT